MGPRYRINLRRLIIVSLVFVASIVAVMFLVRALFINTSAIRDLLNDAPPLEKTETGGDSEYLIPDSRVPETFDERMGAAALSLLPSRVPELETARSPAVPPVDQQAITQTASRFLKSWETFGAGGEDGYAKALAPLTAADTRTGILDRVDSKEPEEVCPRASCLLGSAMIDKAPPLRIIDWNGTEAFVVGSGLVAYSRNQLSRYSEQFWSRSYGLLLRKEGSKWLVTRAAAENTAVIEL